MLSGLREQLSSIQIQVSKGFLDLLDQYSDERLSARQAEPSRQQIATVGIDRTTAVLASQEDFQNSGRTPPRKRKEPNAEATALSTTDH
jgi:hypothetical protein